MLPSIDLRLDNLVKAVEQVILPALPAEQKLAREQARLVIGHLAMIKAQWKYALRFELKSLDAMLTLGRNLLAEVGPERRAGLETALRDAATFDRADIDAVQRAIIRIGREIDPIISGNDGRLPLSQRSHALILDYAQRQSLRERAWFVFNGQEPDLDELPPLADIV